MQVQDTPATASQLQRLAADWKDYAGEPVVVEQIKGTFYGFCSELGARRIAARYRKFEVQFSVTRESWFFCLG